MKTHLDYLDFSKGVGILLVIIGHGIGNGFWINSFHMPLFFFLAGLTFTPPQGGLAINSFIIKKINRIIVPWVFFSILSAVIELFVGKLNPSPDAPFNGPLWFLQTLFVSICIYTLIRFIREKWVVNTICLLLPVIVYFAITSERIPQVLPFGLIRAMQASFFIHIGCLCKESHILERINMWVLLFFSLCMYCIGLYLSFKYYGNLSSASFINSGAYTYNLPLALLTSFGGIGLVLSISKLINRIPLINFLGANSLVIMCVHFPLMGRLNHLCFYCFTAGNVTYMPYKLGLVLLSYIITLIFSIICVQLCKRYLPRLTGYDNLIPVNS